MNGIYCFLLSNVRYLLLPGFSVTVNETYCFYPFKCALFLLKAGHSRALHSTPFHCSAHPFSRFIHNRSTQCKSIRNRSLRSPTAPTSRPYTTCEPLATPISSRAREPPSPTSLHRSHFSIYSPAAQMERLDIRTSAPNGSNSRRFVALTIGYGVEWSSLRGVLRGVTLHLFVISMLRSHAKIYPIKIQLVYMYVIYMYVTKDRE
ncbi:hypothetical protein AVEN_45-1 [Araneus ventricosus]|uniref:Uncharacterized protein n=1 Tax=Araneus ventricosus TaxID=182803 RepID=A0A4Y2HCH2_ARAVE|nr:hypothetical protein AVEN_45-1 [Araneus ventricosus]